MKTKQLFLKGLVLFISANAFSQDIPRGRSNDAPALLAAAGRLYLAWPDKENKRLQISSSTDGINWLPPVELDDKSDRDLSLAYFNGKLYLAWRGNDNEHHVNLISSSDGRQTWSDKITFRDGELTARTGDGPALLSAKGALFLLWSKENDKQVKWMSTTDGITWKLETPFTVNPGYDGSKLIQTSPSLCYWNNKDIVLSINNGLWTYFHSYRESTGWYDWRAGEPVRFAFQVGKKDGASLIEANGRLYAAINNETNWKPKCLEVYSRSPSLFETIWKREWYSTETSDHSPALAFYNDRFFIAWTGLDKKNRVNLMSSTDAVNWDNKITFR